MPNDLTRQLGQTLLIGSGAIGTMLRRADGEAGAPVELLNLRRADAVRELHAAYREAGSQVLVTNTFAANPLALEEAGAGDLCEEANRVGVHLARDAADGVCLVWASVGPLGLGLRLDDFSDERLLSIYRKQCSALAEADALLLETFTEPREARAALQAAGETRRPVIFQIGHTGAGRRQWDRIDALLEEARRFGVAAIGANCRHPNEIVHTLSYIAARTDLPLTVSANAGNPRIDRGRVIYEFSPEAFAAVGQELAARGASVVGGCCGTTPEHIARLAEALKGRAVVRAPRPRAEVLAGEAAPERAGREANSVRDLMKAPRFIVSVEIRADRLRSIAEIIDGGAKIRAAGGDLFSVPDNPGATVGRDALATASLLQHALQIPAIGHLSVTQSNLLRMHSSLLGGWDLGVRGILAVTGDAPSMGHLGHAASRVADLKSSVELLRLIRRLRGGEIANGEEVADPPDYCAGCAVGRATPAQAKWLATKIEAGAEFVFSQPVFSYEDYEQLRDAVAPLGIRFFPGVMPLVSRRSAESLAAGRIPGIAVPPGVAAAFARYESAEDQRRHGLEEAGRLAARIAADARGLYLIMPFGKRCYDDAASIVRAVKSAMPNAPA